MSLINLQLERIGIVGTGSSVPEIEGIVLWDDPDDDDDGPTTGDRSLPVTGGGVFEPGGGRQHENENPTGGSGGRGSYEFPFYDEEGGTGGWGGPRDQGPGLDSPIEVPEDGRPHLFEQEYIPFEDPIEIPPQHFPSGGPFWREYPTRDNRDRNIGSEWQFDPDLNQKKKPSVPVLTPWKYDNLTTTKFTSQQSKILTSGLQSVFGNQYFIDFLKGAGIFSDFKQIIGGMPIVLSPAGKFPCDGTREAYVPKEDSSGDPVPYPMIVICPEFFRGQSKKDEDRRFDTLLHELLHLLDASEFDSYMLEHFFGKSKSDPFPKWSDHNNLTTSESRKSFIVKFWCDIKHGGYNKARIVNNEHGYFLTGKFFTVNLLSGNAVANGVVNSSYNTNLSSFLPPATWWALKSPLDGCLI